MDIAAILHIDGSFQHVEWKSSAAYQQWKACADGVEVYDVEEAKVGVHKVFAVLRQNQGVTSIDWKGVPPLVGHFSVTLKTIEG